MLMEGSLKECRESSQKGDIGMMILHGNQEVASLFSLSLHFSLPITTLILICLSFYHSVPSFQRQISSERISPYSLATIDLHLIVVFLTSCETHSNKVSGTELAGEAETGSTASSYQSWDQKPSNLTSVSDPLYIPPLYPFIARLPSQGPTKKHPSASSIN